MMDGAEWCSPWAVITKQRCQLVLLGSDSSSFLLGCVLGTEFPQRHWQSDDQRSGLMSGALLGCDRPFPTGYRRECLGQHPSLSLPCALQWAHAHPGSYLSPSCSHRQSPAVATGQQEAEMLLALHCLWPSLACSQERLWLLGTFWAGVSGGMHTSQPTQHGASASCCPGLYF